MRTNSMLNQSISQKKAFTLIEMLVVIFVLGVGILSIVVLITRNLSLTKNIHIQNTATILAREGIELAYNYKKTNEMLWYQWNCATRTTNSTTENNCDKYFYTWDGGDYRFTVEGILKNQAQVVMKPLQMNPWANNRVSGNQNINIQTATTDFDTLWNTSRLYLTGINVGVTSFQRTSVNTTINNNVTLAQSISWYTHGGGSESPFARYISFTAMKDIPTNSPISSKDIHHITSTVLFRINNTTTGQVSLESFISNPR